MLSKFGQLVRAFRLKTNLLMSEMAEKLDCSPSYLSAVEFGRRAVPESWPKKIVKILGLSEAEAAQLVAAAKEATSQLKGAVMVSLESLSPLQQDVAHTFARKVKEISEEDLKKLNNWLLEMRSEQPWFRGSP